MPNSLSNILKSMILPESLLKNQKKIKTKNNKAEKKEKKNQEQTVITKKKKQAKIWKNMKKQGQKEERNKKN